jgi:N utilization substance protein B
VKRRSKARALTLQILYAWEMREGEGLRDVGEGQLAGSEAAEETRAYARRLLAALEERRTEIDGLLAESTTHWELHRLSVVDRNVLRLAACELMAFPDVPFRVVIDEAVNLARRYGGDDSPRFVNGVLDALRVRLQGASA